MPDTERMVSSRDHVKNVSFIVNPKYSLNIQKAASLTCDKIKLPAPIAKTTNATLTSDCCTKGKTIAVVQIPATVAEPNAILKIAAIIHANKSGDIDVPEKAALIVSPTPPSMRICLKAPPPPIISNIMPIG